MRTIPPTYITEALKKFDRKVRQTFEAIVSTPISDQNWNQVKLPTKLGGIGIKSSLEHSAAAFISSSNCTLIADKQPMSLQKFK